jgi:UDP-N-acetylmuramoyl-L-alanyl-D-glutamate--2,6-diaminopimelate ligase
MKYKYITDDSRKVKNGSLFVAIDGAHFDGYSFIPEAIDKGATAVVSEKPPKKEWLKKVDYKRVKDARDALSDLVSEFYGNPSEKLTVIGVTGTDGKTTTSHMIYEILKKAGKKVGLISSITSPGLHVTSPEPLELQKRLSEMVKAGLKYVVLETTSHGLAQNRVSGINYEIAVLTNITHEHLDYHKTFKAYRDTKLKLFLNAKVSVLNKDDKNYSYFHKRIHGEKIAYSLELNDMGLNKLMGEQIENVGEYNVANALAARAVARKLKISPSIIKNALQDMKPPKGRLERVRNKKDVDIYIDFAHTPNALKNVLTLLKKLKRGKLIVVFGCAGERDVKKRPLMGRIATDTADISIFTAEDPRSEDINDILGVMVKGAEKAGGVMLEQSDSISERFYRPSASRMTHYFISIPDRGEAIYHTLNKLAKKGDIVVITGKAHEKSMAYDGVEYPWSDFEAVKLALNGKILEIKK